MSQRSSLLPPPNQIKHLIRVQFLWTAALAVGCAAPGAAQEDVAEETRIMIDRLGLVEAGQPVRERPGWRVPQRILVAGDAEWVQWLQPAAPGVELVPVADDEEAIRLAAGADALLGRFCYEEILQAGQDVRWIQYPSAGVARCVSSSALRERDILLTNAQRLYGPEIAEHVLAFLFYFSRGLYRYVPEQQQAHWNRDVVPTGQLWELEGKTMLVLGLGGIGTEVARRAAALGMRVIATRRSSRDGPTYVDYVGLSGEAADLAQQADVVVNALPFTEETAGVIDAAFLSEMKSTAFFINVGRGGTVVTDDLIRALREGQIAGAGLDVTDPEPLPDGHPLWSAPNVLITPHISGGSDLRLRRRDLLFRENLRRYVAGERMLSVVDVERGY
jgi:phosphoglycerate dehydrogenase-like enzyme